MPWSNYLRDKINDHRYGGPDYTRPATVYFSRYTIAPTGTGGGTEVGSRVAITNNATNFPASTSQIKRNAIIIDWGTAGSALGTIVAIGVHDAATAGNLLEWTVLSTPVPVASGDPFQIAVNQGEFSYMDCAI